MYKCLECNSVFDEPNTKTHREGGDYLPPGGMTVTENFCPSCGDGDYEEAKQCRYCGEWFHSDDEYDSGACVECGKNQLTLENGIAYIETDDDMMREFYLEDFMESECKRASKELIDLCRQEWKSYARFDVYKPLDKLRDFIFYDVPAWMEWLESAAIKTTEDIL